MKVVQINTAVNLGSVGRRAEDIGKMLIGRGDESYIGISSRANRPSASKLIVIGDDWDVRLHGIKSRLLDRHAFGSTNATMKFVEDLKKIDPDILHLRNLHGYYLNIEVLFEYIAEYNKPVVWTFHDCWPITGHCSFFDRVGCEKWKTGCNTCPNIAGYPKSWFVDNSKNNYENKKRIFNSVKNMQLAAPCNWMGNFLKESFLNTYPVNVIYNGIDTEIFKPDAVVANALKQKLGLDGNRIILGSANIWDPRKGLADFVQLFPMLEKNIKIVLIGLSTEQISKLPSRILGIERTDNIEQMAAFYSMADVFVNPTYVDNFPTTNLEALASGTPVITYKTGGSPEAIDNETGFALEKGDIAGIHQKITEVLLKEKSFYSEKCRNRGLANFNKDLTVENYYRLYQEVLNKN